MLYIFYQYFIISNKSFFEKSLAIDFEPILKVSWSNNRLKTTVGWYKRIKVNGNISSEIVLSKPSLESWPCEIFKVHFPRNASCLDR